MSLGLAAIVYFVSRCTLAILSEISTNRIIACRAEGYPRIGVSVPYCPRFRLVLLSTAQVVVFMRGTERRPSPSCAASQEVAATLARAGVLWEAVDVSRDTQAELAIRCISATT